VPFVLLYNKTIFHIVFLEWGVVSRMASYTVNDCYFTAHIRYKTQNYFKVLLIWLGLIEGWANSLSYVWLPLWLCMEYCCDHSCHGLVALFRCGNVCQGDVHWLALRYSV
jgi:hypothetical protein